MHDLNKFYSYLFLVFSWTTVFFCHPYEGQAQSSSTDFPKELVTSHGTGPALYLSSQADSPAFGFVSEGVRLTRLGPIQSGRFRVQVHGSIPLETYITTKRAGLRIQKRGKIAGTPVYVAPGNIVRLLEKDSKGRWKVGVIARVQEQEQRERIGIYPPDRLGVAEPGPEAEDPRPGKSFALTSPTVQLFDRPNGQIVSEFIISKPPLFVDVLKDVPGWKGIRLGDSPFLVGYLQAKDLVEKQKPFLQKKPNTALGLPQRLRQESAYPLWKISKGTELYFNGAKIATLPRTAFARELNRYPESKEADVFVALSDDMAIRAMVPLSVLNEKIK